MTNTTTNKSLGALLREVRERAGFTISQAGRRSGLTAELVMHVESDAAMFSTAAALARGLNRRVYISVQRDRKARAVDLAAESGLALDTVYKGLALIADPSRAIGESDLQLQKLYALLSVMDGTVHALRVR